jgi:protoheme IX farnesyltransferase
VAQTQTLKLSSLILFKLREYALLTKFRLSVTVVLSGLLGYLFGAEYTQFSFGVFFLFVLSGLLITCSANAFNEVIEKDIDGIMERTKDRPLPTGRMTTSEAIIAAGVMGVSGLLILWLKFSSLAAIMGAISILSYAFIYTPMKKVSSAAVFVGAIPGALPPAIGYVCATYPSTFNYFIASLLFFIQFLWQFPHFWSIGWLRYEDYLKAGIMMLPSQSGKTRYSAIHSLIYCAFLLIVSLMPYTFGMVGIYGASVMLIMGVFFLWTATQFYRNCDDASAKRVLLMSFAYLPIVQLAMVLDRI